MAKTNHNRVSEIRRQLIDYVEENNVEVGGRIPSEASLAVQFGVSRNTIRELLVQLESEGSIVRSHGRGTYLRSVPQRHGTYQSFPMQIANSGRKPTISVTGPLPCIAGEEVISELSVSRKQQVQRVERLILADQVPVAFVIDHLPARIMHLLGDWQGFDGDMVAKLGADTGHSRFTQNVSVNALACDSVIARKLDLSTGMPVIHIHTIMQTMDMNPVAVTDSYLRPNEIQLDYVGTVRITPDE